MKVFFAFIFEKPKTMVSFEALIKQFNRQGEKTGWTYIEISTDIAQELNPGVRLGYRVKGKLDAYEIKGSSILPMGDGNFILPLNATMRKALLKHVGEWILAKIEVDHSEVPISADLLDCLEDAPEAKAFFLSLSKSHRNYFSKWIEGAKTENTKAKRIQQTIMGCEMHMEYGEMIRYFREQEKKLRS